jgi:DNA-binding transcriptional regulator YhcF (GntR family)
MKIEVNRNIRIPLYLQIKEQLKEYIQSGQLKKGTQLPTERDLSLKLKVSRNTVSMAYKELVQEKIISSISGKGTFIITETEQENSVFNSVNKLPVIRNIDLAIQKAVELNIQLDDFIRLVNHRLKKKKNLFENVHIAFVECNQEQLLYFSQRLELGTGIHTAPVLIDEMYHQKEKFLEKMRSVDLIVTTFFHLKEMQDFLHDENKRIIAIALDPQIETMVQIARSTSPDMNIGLVCLTSKFAERVIKSINNVGIKYRKIEFTTTRKTDELKKLINSSDILIVSPGRKKEIERLITKKIPLIEFIYVPDKGSIETLKKNIFDIKKKEVIYNK